MMAPLPTRPALAGTPLAGGLLIGALLLGVSLLVTTPAVAVPAAAAAASGETCTAAGGVTVVVDFTDLGGGIEVGCASGSPGSGRAALEAAGFHAADSQPGLLCAIDSLPDPCPTTFQGSFWSYWHSAPDGEWTSYQVGADASHPAPGELEGWRYNDGTVGPGIAPADVRQPAATPPTPTASDSPLLVDPAPGPTVDGVLLATGGLTAAVVVLLALLWVRSRRGKARRVKSRSGESGSD